MLAPSVDKRAFGQSEMWTVCKGNNLRGVGGELEG